MKTAITAILALLTISPTPTPASDWPEAWEREFQGRVKHTLALWNDKTDGRYGNTFFENEKRSYPAAMFDILNGNVEPAAKFLQEEDNLRDDNAHTLGIDLYPCFTLKGQVRKYFYFGKHLDREYRERMKQAAKIWTEKDPHRRPHPKFGSGDGGEGWRPQNRGGWVDVARHRQPQGDAGNQRLPVRRRDRQRTDPANLRGANRQACRRAVPRRHERVGLGELSGPQHRPLPEPLRLRQGSRGQGTGQGGARLVHRGRGGEILSRRDRRADQAGLRRGQRRLRRRAARTLWPWFGDTRLSDTESEPDAIHIVTSSYRPPAAVVALARKRFDRPVTLQNTKPPYGKFSPEEVDAPMYWETMHFGRTFALGTVMGKEPQGDVGTFKLTADNSRRGVDYVTINTVPPGGNIEQVPPGKNPGDQIAQHKHLALWLRKDDRPGTRFVIQLPKSAKTETSGDVLLIQLENTYTALLPIGLERFKPAEISGRRAERYAEETLLVAETDRPGYTGFGFIVGEKQSHGSYDDFKREPPRQGRTDPRPAGPGNRRTPRRRRHLDADLPQPAQRPPGAGSQRRVGPVGRADRSLPPAARGNGPRFAGMEEGHVEGRGRRIHVRADGDRRGPGEVAGCEGCVCEAASGFRGLARGSPTGWGLPGRAWGCRR